MVVESGPVVSAADVGREVASTVVVTVVSAIDVDRTVLINSVMMIITNCQQTLYNILRAVTRDKTVWPWTLHLPCSYSKLYCNDCLPAHQTMAGFRRNAGVSESQAC